MPAASSNVAGPSHVLLIDRHIEKNGGTSARWHMQRAERHGACAYFGYELLHDFTRVLESHASSMWPPLCIEAHTSVNHHQLRQLHSLCTRQRWRCIFWLRWREPLSHYISFFRWGTLPRLALRSPADASSAFLQWVRTNPDLQSRMLLDSSASSRAIPADLSKATAPPPVRRAAVLAALDLFGSSLGTTEAFAESLRSATRPLGWPAALSGLDGAPVDVAGAVPSGCRMRNDASRWWCFNASLPAADESARILRYVCPDVAVCRRTVAKAAPLDAEVYKRAQQTLREQRGTKSDGEASGLDSASDNAHGARACTWRSLCAATRRRSGCVRRAGMNASARLALAPSFAPGNGSCYTGNHEVLSKAWLNHPQGGRVLAGRPFGTLVAAAG